jgi:hypothetical protein
MDIGRPKLVVVRPPDPFKIALRLQVLVRDLTGLSQTPQNPEYKATFRRLELLIAGRIDCENDARTAKTIVSQLFTNAISSDSGSSTASPRALAELSETILGIMPDTMRDWTRPGDATNRGKPLFKQLILERARSHLILPAIANRKEFTPGRHERFTIDTKLDRPILITVLSHPSRIRLAEFIGELVSKKLLPSLIAFEYGLKLLHSTSVPSPNRSELEAVCRLMRLIDPLLRSLTWASNVYNALELVRRRAGHNLEPHLRVLLLVLRSFLND